MKSDEDEAFEQIEAKQKQMEVAFTQGLDPYREMVRNQTIDEIARAIEKCKPAFGPDTVASFAIFVRGMKR